jgi:dipeptidyl aminopeptidase/acylaminoacyl peptidase
MPHHRIRCLLLIIGFVSLTAVVACRPQLPPATAIAVTATTVAAATSVTAATSVPAATPTAVPYATLAPTETATAVVDNTSPVTATPTPDSAIAFVSNRDGRLQLYLMQADGTGVTRLTNHNGNDWQPAWSPDGQRLANYSDRDGNEDIYIFHLDGSAETRLTDHPATAGYRTNLGHRYRRVVGYPRRTGNERKPAGLHT